MIKYNKNGCKVEYRKIHSPHGKSLKIMIVRPENSIDEKLPGVLWLHGGGYLLGFPEMVFMSRALDLVTKCGAVVISPAYRLSVQEPYPAAIKDSYRALMYVKNHADELGVRSDQIMVGGESAGGGLAAALCMYARDEKSVRIAFQMPLYPMLNCQDTPSSANNRAKVWNTKRNHMAWKLYLRSLRNRNIPVYASPSKCQNYENLPPAYTFVGDAEPFYCETLDYIKELRKAGVTANVDVYPGGYHAFDIMSVSEREQAEPIHREWRMAIISSARDMMNPDDDMSIRAAGEFCKEFLYAKENYFAPQLAEL
jgi:acetyl esterase/lipase